MLSFFLIVAELVLQPRKIANGYRKAYTIMDAGLNKYGKRNKETGIVKCLDKAEKIIRSVHKL